MRVVKARELMGTDVSSKGMTWNLNSWENTTLNSAGGTYIVLDQCSLVTLYAQIYNGSIHSSSVKIKHRIRGCES